MPSTRSLALLLVLLGSVQAFSPSAQAVTVFPKGDLFKPLLADPQRPRFFAGLVQLDMASVDNTVAPVGFGGQVGLLRWSGEDPRNGIQLGLSAAAFSQFIVDEPSAPQINTDFQVGLPLTFRSGALSLRLEPYHQSSHLGDELQEQGRTRLNFAFEALEALAAVDLGPFRAYGGGEILLQREPTTRDRGMLHTGVDYRTGRAVGRLDEHNIRIYPAAGVDLKFWQDHDWQPAVSANAGLQFHRGIAEAGGGRHFAILGVWHTGPAPYGQFFRANADFYGVTMEFNL